MSARPSASFRRTVVEAYKEEHWHTYWHARFDCGHWGLAPNRRIENGVNWHAKRAICDKCRKGEAPVPAAAPAEAA